MKFINDSGPIFLNGDTIICPSKGVDHDTFDYYAVCFSILNKDGDIIFRSIDSVSQCLYYYNDLNKVYLVGDTLITAVDIENLEDADTHILLYDLKNGDILKKINVESQIDNWAFLHDMVQINDSIYATLSNVLEYPHSKKSDIQISIVNIKSDVVKYLNFGVKDTIDYLYCLHWTGKDFLVGSVYLRVLKLNVDR